MVREDIEAYSQCIYLHSCRNVEKSGISVSVPHTVRCQQHHSNPENSFSVDHVGKNVAIPFLDYLISDIYSRIFTHSKQVDSFPLPVNIRVNISILALNEATFHSDYLPNPNIPDEELCHWKTKWLAVKQQDCPEIIRDTLKQCCLFYLPTFLHRSSCLE